MAGTLIVDKIQVDSGNTFQVVGNTGSVLLSANAAGITFAAGSAAAPSITTNNDTNTGIFFPAADTIAFAEGGAEVARFDSSGNMGLGTTSPVGRLDVRGTSMLLINATNPTSWVSVDSALTTGSLYNQFNTTSNIGISGTYTNHAYTFVTNNAERARIDSSGNFYIGATGQVVNTYLLTLNYSGNAQKGGIMFNDGDSGLTYEACYFRKDGAQRGYIRVATTGTTYATVSDYRLKENVQPMTGALAKIAALKPCTYTWKDSEISSQGFIAHELAEVVPECVTGEKDAVDEDGNIKPQGIDTSFLVATLTAAIQEQQQMIKTLQDKVAALEAAQ